MNQENDNNETAPDIIEDADGKFNVCVSVPGFRHFNAKRRRSIECRTKTTIKMPRDARETKIKLSGSTRSAVELAMSEIAEIADQKDRRLTHFLSIPINDAGIIEKFIQFKNEVNLMDTTSKANIVDAHFQKTCRLHLTLGVLILKDEGKKNSALRALQECREIIDKAKNRFDSPGDLRIKICGVTSMEGNPAKCKVVYGMVESEILQTIANEIVGHFISKGLIEEDKSQVKLHLTMINAIFVTRQTKKRAIEKIDATAVLEKYSKFEFGEQKIDEIHLSRFERTAESAYYQPEGVLDISNQKTVAS